MTTQDPHSKGPPPAAIARRLLDLLSSDDAFRARFAADPTAALTELGASPSEAAAGCMVVDRLASKEAFVAAKEALLAHLTEVAAFLNPHCFVDATD